MTAELTGMDRRFVVPFCLVLIYVMLTAVAYSFISVETTDDVKVFIGAGKQAVLDPSPGPMTKIDNSWELKPIGNKALYFAIATVAPMIYLTEEALLKFFALFALCVVAFIFAVEASRRFPETTAIDIDTTFAFVVVPMLALSNIFLMQAEWWAVLLSFGVLWALLTKSHTLIGLAGLLSVWIIFLKMSTLALIPAIFAAYFLINGIIYREVIIAYVIGFIVGLWMAIGWLFYLPHAIPDMLLSVQLAHASKGVDIPLADGINYLLFYTIDGVPDAPVVGFGIAALLILVILLLVIWMKQGKPMSEYSIRTVAILVILWGMPLASILAQKEFFSYHYAILLFPAVITVITTVGNAMQPVRTLSSVAILGGIVIIWFFIGSMWSPMYAQQDAFWKGTENDSKIFQEKYDLSGEILYLDIASATYYLDTKSACRMVGSLPIDRNLTWTSEYAENLACVKNYQGTYAIAKHGSGMPSLLPNYSRIEEGTAWDLYTRKIA